MKKLIKKANNLTEEQEKFIQECEESGKFNDVQMNQINEDVYFQTLVQFVR